MILIIGFYIDKYLINIGLSEDELTALMNKLLKWLLRINGDTNNVSPFIIKEYRSKKVCLMLNIIYSNVFRIRQSNSCIFCVDFYTLLWYTQNRLEIIYGNKIIYNWFTN